MSSRHLPLVVIVGETASGKSALALYLAQKFNGEIICADAMTVYEGFDIGTAKPSDEERALVPHHLVDVTTASEGYSAPQFQRAAQATIDDIASRGRVPILVGGTGLYIDSVLYDYSFLGPATPSERSVLNNMPLAELIALAKQKNLPLEAVDNRNKRRVIRLIENDGAMPRQSALREHTLVLGITQNKDGLEKRIEARVHRMAAEGLEQEVARLSARYGWDAEPMKAIGYREWNEYFNGTQSREQTVERIISGTKRLAKKQRTWFKRNNSIQWFSNRDEAVATTTTFLNKYRSD
jgi:tRNA dimethylallyltransferase